MLRIVLVVARMKRSAMRGSVFVDNAAPGFRYATSGLHRLNSHLFDDAQVDVQRLSAALVDPKHNKCADSDLGRVYFHRS
jgi:hypothetical protein